MEVCLATLYLATLFPVEFRFWGDPFENYAGLEHSIRSFAVSAGCLPAVGSQRSPPSAPLSPEVTQMAKRLAAVLGSPAVIANLEEYYAALKRMKDGPVDPPIVVKQEPDDANIIDVSAEPGVVDAVPHDSEHVAQDVEAASASQDDAEHVEQSETEPPVAPISTKKRRIGASLRELMTRADDLRVCPICWVHHADYICPRSAESEALYTTLTHMLEGGAVPVADSQMDPTSANTISGTAEAGDVDMGVDAQVGDIDDAQHQPTDADPQDVTDVEVEEAATDDAGDEPPTVLPEAASRAKDRPIRKSASNKMSSDESVGYKSVKFLDEEEDVTPLGKSRELESMGILNIQQLKNQVPQFLEYANPRPFHSGHFINSEGEVDWTRGRPPLTGRVRSLKALELMVSTLQRDEDREGVDFDFGGTASYLDRKREQNLVATLIDNRTERIRFLDKTYHCLGKWGDKNCEFYVDEIYHAGKRLSIWLRHIWLRGNHSTNIDRGGWASIDEIMQDEGFWMDVHRELLRHGHDHRKDSAYAIFYNKDNM